ncbi:MAG: hypothetical protein ACRDTG_29275 [Pseudonocardiaceae bacterium]
MKCERVWSEKRLLVRGELGWHTDSPDLVAARALRERVGLAGRVPVFAQPDIEAPETDRDVLGAAGAWLCVGVVVVLIVVLVCRQLWLWLL